MNLRNQLIAAALIALAVSGTVYFRSYPLTAHAQETLTDQPLASVLEVQEAFRRVSAAVLPSIVEISVRSENITQETGENGIPWSEFFSDPAEESSGPRFFRSEGLGSGVLIEKKDNWHYVVTNAHVIGEAQHISVELFDGQHIEAETVGRDVRKDIALVRFQLPNSNLQPVPIGNSDKLYVGDWVLAFGSPYGYEQSVSSGIVSALGRRSGPGNNINDFIQTDTAINQGNSGGALVNVRGEIIGINTFITTPNRGSIGLGFAIPINNVMSSVRQLLNTGEVRYGWLGVSLGTFGPEAAESLGYPERTGAMVYQVFKGSPADKAGLLPGDLVTVLDDKPVTDSDGLIYRIGEKQPGQKARLTVNRFGREKRISVIMGKRTDEESVKTLHNRAFPGFLAAPLLEDVREAMKIPETVTGVAVAEVYPRTAAHAVDLRAGDLITAVNGHSIASLRDLYTELARIRKDFPSYSVWRNGKMVNLAERKGNAND
ncbi:MAG: serine protease [Spirochaetales bacterium]|nr:MAG: serine protease [Spirochaetales bacterium]